MWRFIPFLIALCFIVESRAQSSLRAVTGMIRDSASNEPVSSATVTATNTADSSLRYFTSSSTNGQFRFENLQIGVYIIRISFQGLNAFERSFSLSSVDSVLDLGILRMSKAYQTLTAVVVTDQTPIKIKGDTVTYKRDMFKTKADATVEDLLKRLPGLTVERNGNVNAQGERVQKVYVDGVEFFNNDPKQATNNLTADMIDEVQVYNDFSEQSKFNGIDDGSRMKAINLKLKKGRKSGVFGKIHGGYGTDNRYHVGVSANYFKGPSQVSLIAGSNNINVRNNAVGDITKGNGYRNPALHGNLTSSTAGLNYRDLWLKKLDISGSYLFDRNDESNLRTSLRRTFLVDSTLLTDRKTVYDRTSEGHQFNLKLIYTIDPFNSIVFTPNLRVQNIEYLTNDTLQNYIDKRGIRYKRDVTSTMSTSKMQSQQVGSSLLWRRRFNRTGRTFSLNLSGIFNQNETNGQTLINAAIENSDTGLRERNSDFKLFHKNQSKNLVISSSFTEPLGVNKLLEVNYSYSNNYSESDRSTSSYNLVTKDYDMQVDTLSNWFETRNIINRIGTNLRGVSKKYNYQLGLSLQHIIQENNEVKNVERLRARYINLLPTASFNYMFARNTNLQVNYRGRNNQPNVLQLQESIDLTAYPFIRKGNPLLKPEFVNNLMITFNHFNSTTLQNMSFSLHYMAVNNKIVNSIKQVGIEQIYMPVNTSGVHSISGTFNYSWPLGNMEAGNFNSISSFNHYRTANLINDVKNIVNDLSIGQEFALNYNINKLDLSLNAGINYNSIRYKVESEQNTSYFTHNYSFQATYTVFKRVLLWTTADYTIYKGKGLNQQFLIWNASVSTKLFKNNRGQIRLSINDILNQNINFRRIQSDNFIEDVQSETLKRFALLTFLYDINDMKKK